MFSTYDRWKTTPPDDYYYSSEDDHDDEPGEYDCYHEGYEGDILTGVATCWRCGHRWHMTQDEIEVEYDLLRAMAEEARPWNRFKRWVSDRIDAIGWAFRRRRAPAREIDDEIPF